MWNLPVLPLKARYRLWFLWTEFKLKLAMGEMDLEGLWKHALHLLLLSVMFLLWCLLCLLLGWSLICFFLFRVSFFSLSLFVHIFVWSVVTRTTAFFVRYCSACPSSFFTLLHLALLSVSISSLGFLT